MRIKEQLVPITNNSPIFAGTNPARYITVHETANRQRGAGAANHANLQSNGFTASWHIQVDDTEAIRSWPDSVRCQHAGDGRGPGNMQSIGIEICVNQDSDYNQALANAADVVKQLRAEHGIPADRVRQHNAWSGKNCPRILRGRGSAAWRDFLAATEPGSDRAPDSTGSGSTSSGTRSVSTMATEVIAGQHGNGHSTRQRSLGISAARYRQVRAEVNRRLLGRAAPAQPARTIAAMATEVIRGQHGNGHSTRQRSLGISAARYRQVRAEVNRRLS